MLKLSLPARFSMSRHGIRVALIALCIVAAESHAQRADGPTILSGSVVFDSKTNLYTYSYALDNTNGSKGVSEITIRVGKEGPPSPVRYASPSGWDFDISSGAGNYT